MVNIVWLQTYRKEKFQLTLLLRLCDLVAPLVLIYAKYKKSKFIRLHTVIFGYIQSYSVIYSHIGLYTVIFGYIQSYSVIYSHIRLYTVIFGYIQSYSIIYSHIRLYTVIFGINCQLIRRLYICISDNFKCSKKADQNMAGLGLFCDYRL